MTMTDPIADMLTRIRNAHQGYKDAVLMPSSKLKESLRRSSKPKAMSPITKSLIQKIGQGTHFQSA